MAWYFLRPGVESTFALRRVEELIGGLGDVRGAGGLDHVLLAQKYLLWSETAEQVLRELFSDADLSRGLHTDRYWRIRDITSATLRAFPLVEAETWDQQRVLEAVREQLVHYRTQLSPTLDERMLLLDTNVYMHGKPFRQVAWNELVDEKRVVLVIPLAVIDELDKWKDKGSDAARSTLKDLDDLLKPGAALSIQPIRANVRMQVVDEPVAHERLEGVDDELVRQASYFSSLSAERLSIVTRDRGMRVRAEAAGLSIQMLPQYLERSPRNRE